MFKLRKHGLRFRHRLFKRKKKNINNGSGDHNNNSNEDMAKRKNIVDNNNSNEGEKTKEMAAADPRRAVNELLPGLALAQEQVPALALMREYRLLARPALMREHRPLAREHRPLARELMKALMKEEVMKERTMEDIEVVGVLSVGDGDSCGGRGGDGSVGDGGGSGGDGDGSVGDGGGSGDGDGSGGDGGGSGGDGDGSGGDGGGSGGDGGGSGGDGGGSGGRGGDCDGDNEGCDKTEGGGKMGTKMEPKGQHDNRNRFSYHGGDENGYPVGQLDRCNYQAAMAVAAEMATAIMLVGIKLKAVAMEKWIPKRSPRVNTMITLTDSHIMRGDENGYPVGKLHGCYYEKPNVCSIIPYQVLV